ncbi:hypothetical protein QQ045_020318 [Rhodiola kirilowii]
MEEWRPISLCTVALKIITKIFAQRLQPILNQVISIYQSAFVKGRIITDNFVVAHEIANFLKNCRDLYNLYASVEVDMSKAYDRIEWVFLEIVLLRMGFAGVWVDRVMKCVSTVSYQVRVNDNISSVIIPSRGLRQGDPISPYLFLFCTELLNAKLQLGISRKLISGIKICKKAPVVSHLFFADDLIFFVKADVSEARNLKNILQQYKTVSGQMINFDKSEVCFSKNTPADMRVDICNVLRIPQVNSHSRYLGLPLVMGQRKTEAFRGILEKNVEKGERLEELISQYWWDKKEDREGVSWISKGVLQKNKCDGGLGFKDLYTFNDAMLMKIGWRMMKFPCLLMSQILAAKYCKGRSIFEDRMGGNPSPVWRGVMKSLRTLLDSVLWDERGATFIWKHTSSGSFSVRSAYDIIKRNEDLSKPGFGEQSDKSTVRLASNSLNPADWVWWYALNLSGDDFRKFLIVIWLSWSNRNRVWHEKDSWSVERAVIIGKNILNILEHSHWSIPLANANVNESWIPPMEGKIKINVDGSWEANSRESASSRRIKEAIFETDSLEVFRAISTGTGISEWCESWLLTVVEFIRSNPGWQIQISSTESNGVAYRLASEARLQSWRWERSDAVPRSLAPLL